MKTIVGIFLLVAMLFSFNGCMTYSSVQRATGNGGEFVEIGGRDQIVQYDGTNCVIKRISPKGETNEMRLHLVTDHSGYVYKPGYYALLPLTVPADIATLPFQLIFLMIAAGSGVIG